MADNLSDQFDRVIEAEVQAPVAEHIPSDEEYVLELGCRAHREEVDRTQPAS